MRDDGFKGVVTWDSALRVIQWLKWNFLSFEDILQRVFSFCPLVIAKY